MLSIMVFATSLVSGCGSSEPRDLSVDLGKNATLDMVLLPNGLWFAKFETTQKQWEAVAGENPSKFKGGENPVENVSCGDCESFISKLNGLASVEKAGLSFRLPTEEEWEFACRAGATGDYCKLADGTEITKDTLGTVGWFGDSPFGSRTHPVGQKLPNAFGLYDMIGNVGEWTSTSEGLMRVFRGGCRSDTADECRASQRLQWSPISRDSSRGFRLCAEVRSPEKKSRATANGPDVFDGLFGEKFGKVMDDSLIFETNNAGALAYEWDPKTRFRDYSDYILFATPKTRQVFQIRAVRDMNAKAADDEIAATVSQLESLFGRKAAPFDDETKVILFDGGDYITVIKKEGWLNTIVFVDACCHRLADLATEEAEEIRKSSRDSSNAAIHEIISSLVDIPGEDFKLGKTEVTQAQWEAVMGYNPSECKNPDNPVERVSWDDCQEFLKKLNALPSMKESGLTFRLPSEEEWERACRAGATGDYCRLADGGEIEELTLFQVAWFANNSNFMPHPVGQKKPNAFGLYDMHGNVWEWTSTSDGEGHVYRGGGWFDSAGGCESSARNYDSSSGRVNDLGFRLCAFGRVD